MKTKKKGLPLLLLALMLIICAFPSAVLADANTDAIEANYKQTQSLTDADKTDAAQKNYQRSATPTLIDYFYKTAEWTDKATATAKITLTLNKKTSVAGKQAVYAFTPCTHHGFTRAIAENNILYLKKNYERVDLVIVTDSTANGIKIYKDVNTANIATVLDGITFDSGIHYSYRLYNGLYDYLMNITPGSETGTETQAEFPTAIYCSFDSFYGRGNQVFDKFSTYSYDCWSILKAYDQQGRYFSMTNTGDKYVDGKDQKYLNCFEVSDYDMPDDNPFIKLTIAEENMLVNTIVGLMDPSLFPGMDSASAQLWNGSAKASLLPFDLINKGPYFPTNGWHNGFLTSVTSDAKYDDTFENYGVPVVSNVALYDVVSDNFEIVSASANDPSIKVKVNNNTIYASLDDYTSQAPVTVTVNIKLKDTDDAANYNKWLNTNASSAIISYKNEAGTTTMAVDSPKLYFGSMPYTITTSVVNGTIDPTSSVNEGTNKTVNYSPETGYKLKSVTVDGNTVDITLHPSSYTFTDVKANHQISVVYELDTPPAPTAYTITTSVVNGTIDPTASVNEGTNKTVNYAPETGYKLKSVTVDGNTVDITLHPSSYTFTDVKANHQISVVYELATLPSPSTDKAPDTGDDNTLLLYAALAANCFCALFVLIKINRKRSEQTR